MEACVGRVRSNFLAEESRWLRIGARTTQSKYRVRLANDCSKFAGDEHADNEPSPGYIHATFHRLSGLRDSDCRLQRVLETSPRPTCFLEYQQLASRKIRLHGVTGF